ncbi:MAG: hypothetical protein ACREXI_02840 [Caldimonas sp.]
MFIAFSVTPGDTRPFNLYIGNDAPDLNGNGAGPLPGTAPFVPAVSGLGGTT